MGLERIRFFPKYYMLLRRNEKVKWTWSPGVVSELGSVSVLRRRDRITLGQFIRWVIVLLINWRLGCLKSTMDRT